MPPFCSKIAKKKKMLRAAFQVTSKETVLGLKVHVCLFQRKRLLKINTKTTLRTTNFWQSKSNVVKWVNLWNGVVHLFSGYVDKMKIDCAGEEGKNIVKYWIKCELVTQDFLR